MRPIIIGVAGGTGSGKTTVVKEIVRHFSRDQVALIQHDSYYRDRSHLSMEERAALNYDHPDALEIHSIKEMTFNNIKQQNRNGLLWLDYNVDGLKTGWFSSAGFHLIATEQREGDRFIAVVMGAKSEAERENAALQLLNYGFRNYKTLEIFTPGKSLAVTSVWKGKKGEVSLGAEQSPFITILRENQGDIEIEKKFPSSIFAPIEQNQELGNLKILVNGSPVKNIPLVALESVEQSGFLKRSMHTIVLSFIHPPYWGIIVISLPLIFLLLFSLQRVRSKKRV